MGYSSFRRDLSISRNAVLALLDHFIDTGSVAYELDKDEQDFGDIRVEHEGGHTNIEVKYDMMAARTGNLCFEISNGKKETGVLTTKADLIYYVVPSGDKKDVVVFDPEKLRTFLDKGDDVQVKNGGDNKRFILCLVKRPIAEKIAEEIFTV